MKAPKDDKKQEKAKPKLTEKQRQSLNKLADLRKQIEEVLKKA